MDFSTTCYGISILDPPNNQYFKAAQSIEKIVIIMTRLWVPGEVLLRRISGTQEGRY